MTTNENSPIAYVYFSDWFRVNPAVLDNYGALNISLINDLPLFIDPFLLFASDKTEYRGLHDGIIEYLKFLRDQSAEGKINQGLLKAWFMFPEVKQLWLGFSLKGNAGAGLGEDFAKALNANLNLIFQDFGQERVTQGSHLEKVCLVQDGVGRDNISDFTANLIKKYLLEYTQTFAKQHIAHEFRSIIRVPKVCFNYDLCIWQDREYDLPVFDGDFVLLCPKDILTRDENWINRGDMIHDFERISRSVPDDQLRAQVNNYLLRILKPNAKDKERHAAYSKIYRKFPALIEYFIRSKEKREDEAKRMSDEKVSASERVYIDQIRDLVAQLASGTKFYSQGWDTLAEARARVEFLKEEVENNGAYRLFYHDGKPIQRESDLQILYRLTWYATLSDFNSEVNNGRGPVDFKVSKGSEDCTLVEFKLAKNSKLKQGLQKQVDIYKKANRTDKALKVIFFFSAEEERNVRDILKELNLFNDDSIILVDVRNDNKPSASNA